MFVLLLLFFLYLIWPGNLVYPKGQVTGLSRPQVADLRENANKMRRDEIAMLQSTLRQDVCVATDAAKLDRMTGLPDLAAA